MAASAAMAETVMQSLGQALTQPAPRNARAGLQVSCGILISRFPDAGAAVSAQEVTPSNDTCTVYLMPNVPVTAEVRSKQSGFQRVRHWSAEHSPEPDRGQSLTCTAMIPWVLLEFKDSAWRIRRAGAVWMSWQSW